MSGTMKPLKPEDVKWLVVHCSGSRCNHPFTVEGLINTGRQRFGQPSYHYYVRRNGTVVPILPESVRGVHASGFNSCSIAVCYEGGLTPDGIADDTRTELQRHALYELLKQLRQDYPQARIVGHCELPGATKPCPCYNCSSEYKDLQPR